MINLTKLTIFARRVERQTIEKLHADDLACDANVRNARVTVKPGKKYAKVDIGSSGRYMVEVSTGNIFGIKAYGQIHKGHFYGTLDTIDDYFWGEYYPIKYEKPTPTQMGSIPKLTFAPETAAV